MPSIFLFIMIFLHCLPAPMIQSQPLAPALYVFGDSLFDSGNNNMLPTVAKADYLPYGVNFAKGVTGRFTNGKTVADFLGTIPVVIMLLCDFKEKENNDQMYVNLVKAFYKLFFFFPCLLAEFLGLPYSPPFMSIRRSTPLKGLNYASGSCGILPETGNLYVRDHIRSLLIC